MLSPGFPLYPIWAPLKEEIGKDTSVFKVIPGGSWDLRAPYNWHYDPRFRV